MEIVPGVDAPTRTRRRLFINSSFFFWKDGREVPDTMDAAMVYPGDLMFTWDSAFGNSQLGTTKDVLGTDGTISCGEEFYCRPQRVNRREPAPFKG